MDGSPNPATCLIPGPVRPTMPNGIRIRSAVFPQCIGQTDRPTHAITYGRTDRPTDRPWESLMTIGRCAPRATRHHCALRIYKVTMTSFVLLSVVNVADSMSRSKATLASSVVIEVFVACVLNLIILICVAVLGMSNLLQIPNKACPIRRRHVLGDHKYRI